MTQTEPVTGAEFLARSLAANGTSHVFFIDAVLRRTLIEPGSLGVQRGTGVGQGWPNIQRQPGDLAELVRFQPTNFVEVAEVFGLRGIRVEDAARIGPALRDALASDETVVVDVATDIDCRAPEPWLPEGA